MSFDPSACSIDPSHSDKAPMFLDALGAILSVPITCVFRLWLGELDDHRAKRLYSSSALTWYYPGVLLGCFFHRVLAGQIYERPLLEGDHCFLCPQTYCSYKVLSCQDRAEIETATGQEGCFRSDMVRQPQQQTTSLQHAFSVNNIVQSCFKLGFQCRGLFDDPMG